VRRIQRHGISVVGSFIMGLDVDRPGIGRQIADTANRYGVDLLNVLFLTPLPGTDLWKKMEDEGRITADRFPEDWKYYTLALPVAHYQHLDRDEIMSEMDECVREFYSLRGIVRRVGRTLPTMRQPFLTLAGNLSYRNNGPLSRNVCHEFKRICDRLQPTPPLPATGENLHVFEGHTDAVFMIAVSADGTKALSGSLDGTMRLWDLETRSEIRTLQAHSGGVFAVAISPDGTRAVSNSMSSSLFSDDGVRIWDLETGDLIHQILFETNSTSIRFNPDGHTFFID